MTLEQILTYVVVAGAAIGAMFVGWVKGGQKEKADEVNYGSHFYFLFKEHLRLEHERNQLLRDLLDTIAPRGR